MLAQIKEHFKNRFSEWIVGFGLFGWGLLVLSNPDLFITTSIFERMVNIAPQHVWGLIAVLIGLIRVTFLFINGTWKKSAHLRAIGSGLSACMWAAIWSSYFSLDNMLPNLASVGVLICLDIYSLWFAAEDAAHSDRNSRMDRDILREVRKRVQ